MTPERTQMIILAGYSAAGKSTLGKELRDNWGFNLIEHQPLVHDLASDKGYARARHWLAEVGIDQFVNESTNEIVSRVQKIIDGGGEKIVVDVAYGVNMLETLKREFPNIYLLVVSIIAGEDTRLKHIQKRMDVDSSEIAGQELHFRDNFLSDVGLDDLLEQKDLEIENNDRPIGDMATELNRLIEEYLQNR